MRSLIIQSAAILFMSGFLSCYVEVSSAQTYQEAQALYNNCEWARARIVAKRVYSANPSNMAALKLYVNAAIPSGKAEEAVPFAKHLWEQTWNQVNRALYAKTMFCAGDLAGAQQEASKMLDNPTVWASQRVDILQTLDICLERTILVEFKFLESEVQYQDHLRPYLHIPMPMDSMLNQESNVLSLEGLLTTDFRSLGEFDYLRASTDPDKEVIIETLVNLRPVDIRNSLNSSTWAVPQFIEKYTLPSGGVDSTQSNVVSLAASLNQGGQSPYPTIKAVLSWCQENINYVPMNPPPPVWDLEASEVIYRGWGHCHYQASVAVALLRANNIPARVLRGHSAVRGDSGFASHHSILEFYTDASGWVPWDYGQTPGVVGADFLAMWRYRYGMNGAESSLGNELWNFHSIQSAHDYVWFEVLTRN